MAFQRKDSEIINWEVWAVKRYHWRGFGYKPIVSNSLAPICHVWVTLQAAKSFKSERFSVETLSIAEHSSPG